MVTYKSYQRASSLLLPFPKTPEYIPYLCFHRWKQSFQDPCLDRHNPSKQKPLISFQLTAQEDLFRAHAVVKQHERKLLCA